jgi:predicted phosphodiesterase
MPAPGIARDVVREYLDKFPVTPTLTLAKAIYKDQPEMFKTVESVRTAIRNFRGQNGKKMRERASDKTHFKEPGERAPFESIPEGLTHYKEWAPCNLEYGRTLVLADLHIPYHDRGAMIAAIKYAQKTGIDAVLLLGDTLDFYAMSFWQNDPRKRDFSAELKMSHAVIDAIRQVFPDTPIIYKEGNHEERLWRYMAVKAPELIGMECVGLRAMIKADAYRLQVVDEKQIIKIGHLHLVHGHEFWRGTSNPVNPARGLYLRGKENALCAHYHQTSSHAEKSMAEDVTHCWSIGCLCDLHPDYSPINKWNHGFCIVRLEDDGRFFVDNKVIIGDEVY